MSRLRDTKFQDFDPNDVASHYKLWAIWTGSTFKTYTGRGPALNGFSSWAQAKLYEYVPNKGWVEHAMKLRNPEDICTSCGGHVKATYTHSPWHGYYHWRRVNGRVTSPPELMYLCAHCEKVHV